MIITLITLGIVIIIITLIVNYKKATEILEHIKIKKIFVNIFQIVLSVIICFILVKEGMNSAEIFRMQQEINADVKYISEQQKKQNAQYNELINMYYEQQKYDIPYIPEGFKYVEGEWNTGYVIQDNQKNQYVWVPCTNKEQLGVTKLERRNFVNVAYMSKDLCYDPECYEFIKSALTYGGYYISRFEIGQEENEVAVSKKNALIWTNINKEEALNVISKMDKQHKGITVSLMNSYAYDTAFEWIINTNDEVTYNIVKSNENGKRYTGTKSYNNIFDLYDTTYEITTEIYSENSVISRGPSGIYNDIMGIYNDIMNEEKNNNLDSRGSLLWEKAENLTFRVILYK